MGFIGNFMQRWRRGPLPDDGEEGRAIPHNPSGRDFLDAARGSIRQTVDRYSVSQNALELGSSRTPGTYGERVATPFGAAGILTPGSEVDPSFSSTTLGLAIPVDTNKVQRIQSYDNIARYPELDWCVGEIANDFAHEDLDGDFIKLKFRCDSGKYSDGADKVMQDEFKRLVSMYDIRTNGYNMMRKFLIEGELCFENVIDPDHPEYGIIGERYIPNMFYDFLRDSRTGQVCGLFLDPERMKVMAQYGGYGSGGNSYTGQSTTVFNAVRQYPAYTYTYSVDMKNKIVMPWEQVTYMNSGVLSEDGTVVFPAIERVVVPVRQLLLMHDAMVILRITRAPERLLFNIDMTGFQPKEAQKAVRRFMEERRSKKAVIGSGALTNVYNAETMLDAYYFWKTSEASGASVTTLGSTAHYNELHDVEYFLHRILKFLNIPWARWSESQANRQDKNSIANEEYSFAQMIVRMQQSFSAAVKKTFITHLRLRGLFEKFDVSESDFDAVMNTPALYELYQSQQRYSTGIELLTNASSMDFLSRNLLLKKILNWTDTEIKENEVNLRREILYKAQTDYMSQKIAADGTPTAGKLWLDPEKYINPPPANPTGVDVNGQGPMPPPGGPEGAPPAGAPPPPGGPEGAPPEGAPPEGMPPMPSAQEPPPPEEGGVPAGAGMEMPPQAEPSSLPEIPEPSVPKVDDEGTSGAEKALKENPEFGDFEEVGRKRVGKRENGYPETEKGVKALERGSSETLKSLFDKTLGKGMDSERSLSEIFRDEFSIRDGEKPSSEGPEKKSGSLKGLFDELFGKRGKVKGYASSKPLIATFRDVFYGKLPMKDVFDLEFRKR